MSALPSIVSGARSLRNTTHPLTHPLNLIFIEARERTFAATDVRYRHVCDVLRMGPGDRFYVGEVNGPRGLATILHRDGGQLAFEVTWDEVKLPVLPVTLLCGLPRPQTARRLLALAANFGVARLVFFQAEKGEPSYADSSLWTSGEWRRHLLGGAEQAFHTCVPEVSHAESLEAAWSMMGPQSWHVALDNYEATAPASRMPVRGSDGVLAVGAERGWSAGERDFLRQHGFTLVHVSERVFRCETACTVALGLVMAALGEC
jgi:16S rRNA (uracil1498-N3)-methyltransferase